MTSGNNPNKLNNEAFLARLENKNCQIGESQLEIKDNTRLFLERAGVDISSVDPSSLVALNQLFITSKEAGDSEKSILSPETAKEIANPQKDVIQKKTNAEYVFKKKINVESKDSSMNVPSSTVVKPSIIPHSKTSITADLEEDVSKLILEQLAKQNAMILDMQHRIDYLTGIVQHMSTQNDCTLAPSISPPPPSLNHENHTQQQHFNVEQRNHMMAENPAPRGFLIIFYEWIKKIPDMIRESKTYKLWCLFWLLYRRNVRLDVGLVLKMIMAIALFSAKMMSRKKDQENAFWSATTKLYLVITLVITGFLIQGNYIKFLYRFFIKENYIERIYRGENINADDINWNEPPRANNQVRNNNFQNRFPRDNLLAGMVPRPRQNGINVLSDILILLSSFVLSLLPVWKPEGAQVQQNEGDNRDDNLPNVHADLAGNDADNEDDNNNNNERQN